MLPIFSNQTAGNRQQATRVTEVQGSRVSGEGSGNPNPQTAGNQSAGSGTSTNQHISTSAHEHIRLTTRLVSGRDAFTTPSIRGALNDAPLKERGAFYSSGNLGEPVNLDQPFTQEKLTEVWKTFVERIDAPQLKSALSSREPRLTDQGSVRYDLDNELQLQRLTLDLKPKLLGYLRRELKNESIEIDFLIVSHSDEKPYVPYTESEKWQALVEKYPSLTTLKSKFGLDFEQ